MNATIIVRKTLLGFMAGMTMLFYCYGASGATGSDGSPPAPNKYFSVTTTTLPDGRVLEKDVISGPPTPPPGFEFERQAVSLPEPDVAGAIKTLTVPAYNWVFGCSAVSGAMIAAYYDRNGYPNMYTGPTGGGVMPLDNSSWPTWSDGVDTYPNCPLIASKNGVDGRATKGSIDDYWVQYQSAASDPYITGSWTQHTWGTAIGDYMKTSQSAYSNTDGSTTFWNYTSSANALTCADMVTNNIHTTDGTYGRKLFYEARGYTVTDCYNRKTDNTITGGFSFADYKAQIDAGRPVMLNLEGHTVVGVGYDDSSNLVYLHDTWDYNNHTMTWGGSYSGMQLLSVSIVNLASAPLTAVNYSLITPSSPALVGTSVAFTAAATGGTAPIQYQFWLRNPAGTWSIKQAYSNNATWTWSTTGLAAGTYTIQVWAKSAGSTASYEAYKSTSYVLKTPVTAVNYTSITPSSPAPVGTSVAFTAAATGGTAPVQYQFWLKNPAGVWSLKQAYSSSATWTWNTTGLATGTYKIQVWAKNSGVSASYEAYKETSYTLTTTAAGFYTHFTSATGWQQHNGSWSINLGTYYQTPGIASQWSSSSYNGGTYTDFHYVASIYRAGGSADAYANTLLVRFDPGAGFSASTYEPKTTYEFSYANNGYYSVWKIVGGVTTNIQPWTASSYVKSGWNTLAVNALGSSFNFFINGSLVWSGTDASISSGRVGLMKYSAPANIFEADQATLLTLSANTQKSGTISPMQQRLNAEARARGAAGQSHSHSPR